MKAVFADAFYWVALINPADPRYRDAVARDEELSAVTIFTTDEVLTEFLTFFAADTPLGGAPPEPFQRCSTNRVHVSFRKAGKVSCLAWTFTGPARTRATAWPTGFRCKPCAGRG